MIELPPSASERPPATFQGIFLLKPDADPETDDTVPFDFSFAGSRLIALSDNQNDDRERPVILCRIAHIHVDCSISDCGGSILQPFEN